MSAIPQEGETPSQIIIVRRGKSGEEGHHGGAWKIAFADFMTAMMALFLVLWLVNAANEETKKSVASYFNPVKLVDRNRSERGLSEADGPSRPVEEGRDGETELSDATGEAASASGSALAKSRAFFDDAEETLEALAQKAARADEKPDAELALREQEPVAVRDPYASLLFSADETVERDAQGTASARAQDRDAASQIVTPWPVQEVADQTKAFPEDSTRPESEESFQSEANKDADEEPAELEERIQDAVRKLVGRDTAGAKRLEVRKTDDGLLVTLLDNSNRPMFDSGSARPSGELVLLVEAVASVLNERSGSVRISGHTDARPFLRRDDYDNWSLSTDRAHAARLMLLRGGLAPERLAGIVGYGAQRLRDPERPAAAINRRIEILLEPSA